MRRLAVMTAAVGAIALLSACSTARVGSSFPAPPSTATGTALIQHLGAPDAVRRDGDGKLLRWDAKQSRGMTFGLGYYAARLVFNKSRSAQDRVYARVDADDRVREVRVLRGSRKLRFSLWPFTE